jgi:hypothetical protein
MASTERLRKVPKHSEGSKINLKSPEVPWPPTHIALRVKAFSQLGKPNRVTIRDLVGIMGGVNRTGLLPSPKMGGCLGGPRRILYQYKEGKGHPKSIANIHDAPLRLPCIAPLSLIHRVLLDRLLCLDLI